MRSMACRRIMLFTFAALVTACAPRRIPLDPGYLRDTSRKIGVALTRPPVLAAHRAGAQGLLDMAINSAVDGNLESHLKTMGVGPLDGLADACVERLKGRGLEARKIDPERLTAYRSLGFETPRPSDLRVLARNEGVDAIILLTPRCGTIRSYYGFIPLTPPSGYCAFTGKLIDLKTGRTEWAGGFEGEEATIAAAGEWDQAPDYPNLTVAIQQAMTRAHDSMLAELFGHYEPAVSSSSGSAAGSR